MKTESKRFLTRYGIAVLLIVCALMLPLLQAPSPGYATDTNFALQFDGNTDYVKINNKESIIFGSTNWTGTKSISVWVKPLEPSQICDGSTPSGCKLIVGDRPRFWGIYRGLITVGQYAGLDRIWIWNQDSDTMDVIPIMYTPGEWIHITLVHADGHLSAYRYGFLAGSRVSGNSIGIDGAGLENITDFHIGGGITNAEKVFLFRGVIDEVRVYSRALTGEDIRADLFRESTPTFEPALKAYYRMSDGSGFGLTDDSGNGNHGTLLDGKTAEVPPDGTYPLWVTSDVFGDGTTTPIVPPTFTVTATFTNTPSITPSPTRTLSPTPYPPGFTPSVTPTRTATLNPNFTNFLFMPLVSK